MSPWRTLLSPRCRQKEIASGARSTPTFFCGFPSRRRIAPVPQPTSRISLLRQSGNSEPRTWKIRRCNAPYHQCVSSTRNIVSYSFGRISSCVRALDVTDDILRRPGLIEVKPAEVFTDESKNHQLDAGKQHNGSQHRGKDRKSV